MRLVKKVSAVAGLAVVIGILSASAAFGSVTPHTVSSPSGMVTCAVTETSEFVTEGYKVTCSGTTQPSEFIEVNVVCNTGYIFVDRFGTLNNATRSKSYGACGSRGFEFLKVAFTYNQGNG